MNVVVSYIQFLAECASKLGVQLDEYGPFGPDAATYKGGRSTLSPAISNNARTD